MASQTDRKEEFRKYLDKGNVLSILTTVLTDLFELEPKPEDPALYLYQKIGEAINKDKTTPTANHTETPQKDVEMKDTTQTTPAQPTKPAETEATSQQKPAQESVETKPAPPEHTDPPSQPPTQSDPSAAAATPAATSTAPLSVPATSQ